MEEGPIELGGVNDFKVKTPHGVYCLKLPLTNGKNAVLDAVCFDKITTTLQQYQLVLDVDYDQNPPLLTEGVILTQWEERGGSFYKL